LTLINFQRTLAALDKSKRPETFYKNILRSYGCESHEKPRNFPEERPPEARAQSGAAFRVFSSGSPRASRGGVLSSRPFCLVVQPLRAMPMQHEPKIKSRTVTFGDLFLAALIILVVCLPFYIHFSGSKLSYTPEPEFPTKAVIKTNIWTK